MLKTFITFDDSQIMQKMDYKIFESNQTIVEFTINDKLKELAGPNVWDKVSKYIKGVAIGNFAIFGVGSDSTRRSKIKDVKVLYTRNSITKFVEPSMISFICGDGKEYYVNSSKPIKIYKEEPKEEESKGTSSGRVIIYDKFRELKNIKETLDFLRETLIGKLIRFRDKKDREIKSNVLNDILLIPGSGNATKNSYYILRCEGGHQYEVDMYYPIDYMSKPMKKEIAIWDKFLELGRSYENLLNYLKETLIGKVVKFKVFENGRAKTGDIVKQKVDDVKLSQKLPDVIFVCDGIEYKVNMVFMVEYYDVSQEEKRAEKIVDYSLEDEDVLNYIMLIGVPSGEVVRVNRKNEFNNLYAKRLIFFANNYKPTFYGFRDEDKGKIIYEIRKDDFFEGHMKEMT